MKRFEIFPSLELSLEEKESLKNIEIKFFKEEFNNDKVKDIYVLSLISGKEIFHFECYSYKNEEEAFRILFSEIKIFINYKIKRHLNWFYCQICRDEGYLIDLVKDTDLFDDATERCMICGSSEYIKEGS